MRDIQIDQNEMCKLDIDHLTVDCIRVYKHISVQWLKYIKHLKINYPYLYVTSLIKNPYDFRNSQEIELEIINKFLNKQKDN